MCVCVCARARAQEIVHMCACDPRKTIIYIYFAARLIAIQLSEYLYVRKMKRVEQDGNKKANSRSLRLILGGVLCSMFN